MKTTDLIKEEQTRKEIITAAQELFQKYGIDKTTMDDIADAVGKGKSSLYYYYKSKEEVFYAVVNKEKDEIMHSIGDAIKDINSASEQFKMFFLTHFTQVRKKLNLYSVIIKENAKKHIDLFYKIQKESLDSQISILKNIMLTGMKKGEFQKIKEEECEALVTVIIMMLQGMDSNLVFARDKSQTIPSGVEKAIDVFIKGLKYGR